MAASASMSSPMLRDSSKLNSFLWEHRINADVEFLLEDEIGTPTTVKAHKLVLAAHSSVFQAAFYGTLREDEGKPIPIPDVSAPTFVKFLRFLYVGSFEKRSETVGSVMELYAPANKYMIEALEKMCVDFLIGKVNPEQACTVYEFAQLYNIKSLVDKCLELFKNDTKAVVHSADFLKCKRETVSDILKLEKKDGGSPNLGLFQALAKWSKRQCELENQPAEGVALRRSVEMFFPYINFDAIPTTSQESESVDSVVTALYEQLKTVKITLSSINENYGTSHTPTVPSSMRVKFVKTHCGGFTHSEIDDFLVSGLCRPNNIDDFLLSSNRQTSHRVVFEGSYGQVQDLYSMQHDQFAYVGKCNVTISSAKRNLVEKVMVTTRNKIALPGTLLLLSVVPKHGGKSCLNRWTTFQINNSTSVASLETDFTLCERTCYVFSFLLVVPSAYEQPVHGTVDFYIPHRESCSMTCS